jgi:hypothetical protein
MPSVYGHEAILESGTGSRAPGRLGGDLRQTWRG